MKPKEVDSDCKLFSNSSKRLILGHYKCVILACDVLCVSKLKRNM